MKPKLAWHECLEPIKRPPVKDPKIFEAGKAVHRRIEAIVGEQHLVEQEYTYSDLDLPFDIAYHPDILRQEVALDGAVRTYVYEVKPLTWFLQNRTYCEAQASGYAHFTGAHDALFILYRRIGGDDLALSVLRLERTPWPLLRKVALEAYAAMPHGEGTA